MIESVEANVHGDYCVMKKSISYDLTSDTKFSEYLSINSWVDIFRKGMTASLQPDFQPMSEQIAEYPTFKVRAIVG